MSGCRASTSPGIATALGIVRAPRAIAVEQPLGRSGSSGSREGSA
jgi:hypothetical protein